MSKTYTADDAAGIFKVTDGMVGRLVEHLTARGIRVRYEWEACGWWLKGEYENGDEFLVEVSKDGRTAGFSGDMPAVVRVTARAMMAMVGPYLTANDETA